MHVHYNGQKSNQHKSVHYFNQTLDTKIRIFDGKYEGTKCVKKLVY